MCNKEFNDEDSEGNTFAFRGMKHFCRADYFINEEGRSYGCWQNTIFVEDFSELDLSDNWANLDSYFETSILASNHTPI